MTPGYYDDELSLPEIKNIFDQLKEMGTMLLTFSGGEIFLRNDLIEILEYAAKHFLVILLTNGTLISSYKAKEIKKTGVMQVEVSIYGACAEIHDQITRTHGSYSKTMRTLEILKKEQIPTVIKYTTMKQNIQEYNEVKKIALQLGARLSISHFLIPKRDGSRDPLFYRTDEYDLDHYISNRIGEGIDNLDFAKGICNAGSSSCSISSTGMVSPCAVLPLNLGSLRKTSFRDIWQKKPLEELKCLRSATKSDMVQCKNCDISNYCNPCPGANYLECGDILKCSAEFCRTARCLVSGLTHSKEGG
jgi:radical SAM protein with 4Fe4S-binding SPASM domain